ncbi:6,7-dimethyl-8-ribityllumazine synthase [Agrilactobacillus yilanensis]|uniref:6,7-dimethyl-8-ribityllumazine synthase n=1 Tax=Agrilactobacillus yilanensis TaxID=2485997 RepID=A0ABW4J4P2_9LACO|nr:6,7-dimethyl-8-ribityllumazine synthase [Agrilactobacillus yilanensis]
MTVYQGNYQNAHYKPAIVVARFNEFVTSKLLTGALDMLSRHDIPEEQVAIYWVPGAFEIPFIAKKLANSGQYDGVIALGAVIRGATSHYELVSNEVAKGIAQINLNGPVPVMFGVVTTDTIEQAIERSGTKAGNKGADAALSLLEMMSLTEQIK